MNPVRKFSVDQKGAAAAEMVLVMPLLIVLMFGAFELGHFFWNEHIVVKSVRDAARYASRQENLFSPDTCTPGPVTSTAVDNLARYGKVDVDLLTDAPLVRGWSDPITIELECPAVTGYSGIYDTKSNIPIVMVSATVPYPSLFGILGFESNDLNLNAQSRSAVTGL